ncbi:MAG: hypothetical protein AAFR38_10580 [Planctomycetota bacterium]
MTGSRSTMRPTARWLLRASAVLWAIWGIVHVLAGVMTLRLLLAGRTAEAIQGITARVPLEELAGDYHPAASAVLSQHAMNLAWFGLVTLIAAPFVWIGRRAMVYTAVLVGGMADLAFFIFIDLGGFAAPPGPQMTYICAGAIVTGLLGVRFAATAHGDETSDRVG